MRRLILNNPFTFKTLAGRCAANSFVVVSLLMNSAHGQDNINQIDIDSAEKIMTQRYQVERETSQLLLDWQTEQQQLQDQTALYLHEHNVLSDKLKQKKQQQSEVQAQRENLLKQQLQAESQAQDYQALLDSGFAQITTMWPWLPESLQLSLEKEYSQLLNQQGDLSVRMLALTDLVKQIEKFDNTVNLHLGEMSLAGKRWQAEQLYLGLAQAFYRLPDGSAVGIGVPTAEGWQWQAQPQLQDTINKAFAIYKQQRAPELIALPIQLVGEGK